LKPIYLDYNATTPIHPEAADAMMPYLRHEFGNPSNSYRYGTQARKAVESARSRVAGLLGCQVEEVVFTSGGSESNNLAIKGFTLAHRRRGNHIITSQIEHPAVLEVCRYLESLGFRTTYLPVDSSAMVSPDDVERAIRPETILITIMLANNEVGTIEPLSRIAALARAKGVIVHTDAAQAVGKIPVSVQELGVDMLSIAGHKLYAPKGVGALYVRQGIELESLIHGAAQERGRRAGTENVLEIVGLGKACEIATRDCEDNCRHLARMRDRLQQGIASRVPSSHVNGHHEQRLPNTLSVSFPGRRAQEILAALPDVACSAGAACHSDRVAISHVLEAMKLPEEFALGTIRLSTGRMTTEEEIDSAVDAIAKAVSPK
jgi:cysteine desulfurase